MNAGINKLTICIKGAGEIASAVAWRLYQANLRRIFMLECSQPLAVRRQVSFCEAVYEGYHTVEGVKAVTVDSSSQVEAAWSTGAIAILIDPSWEALRALAPDVCVDAIMAKTNLGTTRADAPLVIGLGPGFIAQKDVHMVIETNRGHDLGRIFTTGGAEKNTGIPGSVNGFSVERVLRSPQDGLFQASAAIGEAVNQGDYIGSVGKKMVQANLDGVVRGLIRSGTQVTKGLKLGDIDPRGNIDHCATISDKARAIAGSVLEGILRVYLVPAED